MQKNKRAWTIKQFVTHFMIWLMLFQSAVFAIMLTLGGSLRNIAYNGFEPFTDTVKLRADDFESKLVSAEDLLAASSSSIKDNLQSVANKYGKPISELGDNQNAKMEMYIKNADILRTLATKENISGAFLILDTRIEVEKDKTVPISGVVMRKTDQATENVNAPTMLLVGGEYLTQNDVTHKSIYWTECLQMSSYDNFDFYTKPIEIARLNNGVASENLGYWSYPYDINDGKREVVAYSLPIRDSANQVVGVMGIEMNLSYMQLLLPFYELNSQGKGIYLITSAASEDASEGTRVFTSGNGFNTINNYSQDIEFSSKSNLAGVYTLAAKGKNIGKVYCTKNTLNIYKNAQYDYAPWVLSGVVESKYLLAFLNRLKWNIALAFLATMILCVLFVVKFADRLAAPINSFVDTIKKIRPDNLIRPEPTRIAEINELGTSIADLTEEISSFTKKTTAILSMTGISIAAFEYDPNSNLVFCTEDTFNMFGMYHKENELFMDKAAFNSRMIPMIKEIKADIDVISPVKAGVDVKWLHIKTVESDGKIIGTIRDVTEETIEKQQREFERDHDPLTLFLNRQPFIDQLTRIFNVKAVNFALLAVCKLPDLSALNTRYGSIMGDKYIKSISEVLGSLDKRTATMARTLGDELAFMIEGRSVDEITMQFNDLLDKLNTTSFKEDDVEMPHNIFAGVAWYPNNAKTVEELLSYAEFASKSASEFSGRNLVQQFSPEAYKEYLNKQKKHAVIAEMLEKYEINYAYQPIIDTSNGEIYGYEALMRPKAEGITPGDVMEYAASNDAFYAVERTTWLNALKGFSQQVDFLSPKKVFINSIPNQLLIDQDIAILEEKYKNYLDNVVLEILENEQTDNDFIEKKRALKEKWGCLLALDDFGSGYANENSLLTIKPDLIKLDLDLVANIDEDSDRQSLVKNIVGYAHNRNIKVLAEGIETREQMNILLSLDVDLMQGFYLAKPNEVTIESIDPKVKEELTSFDPNDMFTANVALRM